MSSDISVTEAQSEGERRAAFKLRYQVYVQEMQTVPNDADHVNELIVDAFDRYAMILIAKSEGTVVGTMRVNLASQGALPLCAEYEVDKLGDIAAAELSVTSRFVVDQSVRRTGVAAKMMITMYRIGRERGVRFNFIDCRPHLMRLYQAIGYRLYKSPIRHSLSGTAIPMLMVLGDEKYLRLIRSPLASLSKHYPDDAEGRALFEGVFPQYRQTLPNFALEPDELWTRFQQDMEVSGKLAESILFGFDPQESAKLLSQFDEVSYRLGDIVFRQDDFSAGMFLVLSGSLEIFRTGLHGPQVLDVIGTGEVFGEMGFVSGVRRTATVKATTDVRLLVLSPSELEKLQIRAPIQAARFLRSLFSLVCQRFVEASAMRSTLWARLEESHHTGGPSSSENEGDNLFSDCK